MDARSKTITVLAMVVMAVSLLGVAAPAPASAAEDNLSSELALVSDDSRTVIKCHVTQGSMPTEAGNNNIRAWGFVLCTGYVFLDGGLYIYENGVKVGYAPLRGVTSASVVALVPCFPGGRYSAALVVRASGPGIIPSSSTHWSPRMGGVVHDCR
jgi:hypothetical protein